jgi:sugar transferase (PEP-CTERM/EpsH1 system associated)
VKIKILHILHSLEVGGLENGVVNLINRLDSDLFEHAICCVASSGAMANRIEKPVEIYSLGKGGKKDYLLSLRMAWVIKNVRPDIVHTRNWGTIDGVIASRLAGVKRIIHGEHGRDAGDPEGMNSRRNRLRRTLHPLISRFVAVSADLKNWLIDIVGIPEAKTMQIINGVDTFRFRPAKDKSQAKVSLGLDPHAFVIGTVGRLDPVKDHKTLLHAFALMTENKSHNAGKYLVIAGPGPEEQNLKKFAEELGIAGDVNFLGERKDISHVLRAMDVYVLPSIAEGISNTVLEAMATGLPVIATKVGGNPELIEDNNNGFLFGPGDAKGLEKILSLYFSGTPLAKAHGDNGRARAEKLFSLSNMTADYETLYLEVAGQ